MSGSGELRRVLQLRHLILYGIVSQESKGPAILAVLIALVAMLFTAISYGRMARVHSSAGSAYTYVGREVHPIRRVRDRMGHDAGLCRQPGPLHDLVCNQYQLAAELLNFGAFIAFMGVNLAALLHAVRHGERRAASIAPPIAGFLVCLYIWLNLRPIAQISGAIWLASGLAYASGDGGRLRQGLPGALRHMPCRS